MQTGEGDMRFLRNSFEKKRRKGLLDTDKLDSDDLDWYQISGSAGGGSTDPDSFTVKQSRWSVKHPKKIDLRDVYPWLGD